MSCEIHVGDIGTQIIMTILDSGSPVDLSSSINTNIIILRPDSVVLDNNATLYTDGTDGIIRYISIAGDFNVAGIYKVQAYVELSSGSYKSNIETFRVFANLN